MADAVTITVRVTARAGRDEVIGPDAAGILHVRVAAAPTDGAANRAVLRTLAASLDRPPTTLELVSGSSSRTKRVRLHRVDPARVLARWPGVALV